ncbi:hypothetical protein [Pandoraea terrigena]|uniref:Uncharacterized protein n=1 Tax=Pandoraea terrigena TaxID=2508292 RepID=A0A5E4URS2_9BURK|nr:hypothetical protein [Pandoraea terrigena]VVE01709.1 hypothetical protein PTE31013_02177 [Pandoraea terrigena]
MKHPPKATEVKSRFSDLEALQEIEGLLSQRKALEQHADSIPAQIDAAKRQLEAIGGQILDAEMELLTAPEKSIPKITKQRDDLETQQVECELRIRRLQTQLAAIEARAPEIDEKITVAIGFVKLEATIASEEIQAALAEDIRRDVAALRRTYAKVRTLQALVPMPRTSDFLLDAYVPDIESCMRVDNGATHYNTAPNLLAEKNSDTERAAVEIAEALKPITDALHVCRAHRPYVPIAKRPQPYQFRGSNQGPARGLGSPIGEPAPPIPVNHPEPTFKGYKTAEAYQIKGDQSGIRTQQAAAAEMDMGRAIMQAAESREH